jgi:hypothetical protein
VGQAGTGSGIDITDCWSMLDLSDVLVNGTNASITAGTFGIRLRNQTLDGGQFGLTRCYTEGKFDIGCQLGANVGESGYVKNVSGIAVHNCVFQQGNTGLLLGHGVKGLALTGCHLEFCYTQGIHIVYAATAININGCFFYNPAATAGDICIEGDSTSNGQLGINIIGNRFDNINSYGINFINSPYTSGSIIGNIFASSGTPICAIKTTGSSAGDCPWVVMQNTYTGMTPCNKPNVLTFYSDALGNLKVAGAISPNPASGPSMMAGEADPTGAIQAYGGSVYMRSNGNVYIKKTSGLNTSGWTAL